MDLREMLEELKRRRVVRAAIGYAAALFVVLQLADIIVPAVGLPDSVLTGLVVVGALGFPLAIALAWAVDLTPGGLERTRRTARDAPSKDHEGHALPGASTARTALLLVGAILVVAGSIWWTVRSPTPDAGDIRKLAVLPLANLMGDDAQLHFVDGMQDLLIGELARIEGLSVISQRSVLRFRDSDQSMATIAGTLDVDARVEGSVFRQGDSVRVTARLIRAEPETDLWQNHYEGRLSEAMTVQARVARAIADEIQIALTDATARHLARDTRVDPAAMDAFLLGRELWKTRDARRMERAIEHLERAVELDPRFARGWAGLADGYTMAAGYEALPISRGEAARRAEAAVERALEIDPTLLEAHAARGALRLYLRQDFRGAEDELSRVVELAPSDAQAHDWLGDALAGLGRLEEALRHYRRAVELDPLSPLMHRDYARALYQLQDCDGAIEQAERALELDPGHFQAADLIARCKLRLERATEVVDQQLANLEAFGVSDIDVEALRRAWEAGGLRAFLREDARQMAGQLHILAAVRYAEADDADAAFEQISQSMDNREALLFIFRVEPAFDALRGDPRWDEAIERLESLADLP
jgi:TolB-like protein/Tfp pilus assembly protein PilF